VNETAPPPAAAPAKVDPRQEVTAMLKGPVAAVIKNAIPQLKDDENVYRTVMANHELLYGCTQLFRMKRDLFAEFLVDEAGQPVTDDDARLKCGRSVNEVIGMVVRTGMRNYAEAFFGDPIVFGKPSKAVAKKPQPKSIWKIINLSKLSELFRRNYGIEKPLAKGKTRSGRFYESIKDHLDFEWQIRFFPIYVEIPSHVFEKLGIGITRMDTEERLQRLAKLAIADINKAESIIGDPELCRQMIDCNVLAASTVSDLGKGGFEALQGALANVDPKKMWDVFANRETAKKLHEDRRISKQDIEALAPYLDILNETALDAMLELHLTREQMAVFLSTAEENLGHDVFRALFGPLQTELPEDPEAQERVKKYQRFVQTALRNLVSAVKQLHEKNKSGEASAIQENLATVCRVRRRDMEAELPKLLPK
jgi:hypothetical protein